MKDTIIIIQARLGSNRLPGKVLLPFFQGRSILEILIDKIRSNFPDILTVVATTNRKKDDSIADFCVTQNIHCYRGSENDVLSRFIETALVFNSTRIVRICPDNPFLNMEALQFLISHMRTYSFDYCSFRTAESTPAILTQLGFWAEVIELDALKKVQNLTRDAAYLEHVTNFIYSNPKDFNLGWINLPSEITKFHDVRLTLDTPEDFDVLKQIYSEYNSFEGSIYEFLEIVHKNQAWTEIMKKQILINKKA